MPPAIDISILRFHICSTPVIMIDISSGIPWLPRNMLTFLRQYITSIPKTAEGRYFPRYCTYAGVYLFSLNIKNGRKRVSIVAAIHIAIVIICCDIVI